MNIKLIKKNIDKIILDLPVQTGCYNAFFKINDFIGIKICRNKRQRDIIYNNQLKASKLELGPDVYGKLEVFYNGSVRYAYLTEIVDVLCDQPDLDEYQLEAICNSCEISALIEDISEVFDFNDIHDGNIGIKNNKYICIDFDDEDAFTDCDTVEDILEIPCDLYKPTKISNPKY